MSREPRRNFWDFPDTTNLSYQKYLDEKVKPQLKELLSNYGKIGMIWFDTPELTTLKQSIDLEMFIKRIQPDCIINTRVGNDVAMSLKWQITGFLRRRTKRFGNVRLLWLKAGDTACWIRKSIGKALPSYRETC